MVTQGCVITTSEMVTAGSVTVASGITPMAGTARLERTLTILGKPKVISAPLAVTVVGDDLVINLAESQPGSLVCWTAYS